MTPQAARTNPGCESTVTVAKWIRQVKGHCTSPDGEIKANTAWTNVDGGSILVANTGRDIIAKEETKQVI